MTKKNGNQKRDLIRLTDNFNCKTTYQVVKGNFIQLQLLSI